MAALKTIWKNFYQNSPTAWSVSVSPKTGNAIIEYRDQKIYSNRHELESRDPAFALIQAHPEVCGGIVLRTLIEQLQKDPRSEVIQMVATKR
jgi:hypothetical protein